MDVDTFQALKLLVEVFFMLASLIILRKLISYSLIKHILHSLLSHKRIVSLLHVYFNKASASIVFIIISVAVIIILDISICQHAGRTQGQAEQKYQKNVHCGVRRRSSDLFCNFSEIVRRRRP